MDKIITIIQTLILAGGVFLTIRIWKNPKANSNKLRSVLTKVGIICAVIVVYIGSCFARSGIEKTVRYDSIGEMLDSYEEDYELYDIAYYEEYAAFFLRTPDGYNRGFTSKDERGWKRADLGAGRMAMGVIGCDVEFMKLDDNLYYVAVSDVLGGLEPDIKISDSEGSVFQKGHTDMYYAFIETTNLEYTIYVNDASLQVKFEDATRKWGGYLKSDEMKVTK